MKARSLPAAALVILWTPAWSLAGFPCFDNSDCDDLNPCTNDVCRVTQPRICLNPPRPNGTTCSDGSACTLSDSCSNGVCRGTPRNCDDGNLCTTDSCSGGSCLHAPINCADFNLCTSDFCNPSTGCVHVLQTCDDNNPCTSEFCAPSSGVCVRSPGSGPCDDGDECTTDDVCDDGDCVGDPVTCEDGNVCTTDTCDPAAGCVFNNNDDSCDDGDDCTPIEQCQAGVCAAVPQSNLEDWGRLQECYVPAGGTVFATCLCFDTDEDLDIDLLDVAEFMVELGGG